MSASVLLWVCGARFDFVAHILQLELHGRHIWGPRPTSRWWGYLLIYVREHSGSPTTINTWLSSWWKGKEVARRPPDVLMIVMAILYLTRCEFSAVLHCSRVTLLYCSHSAPSPLQLLHLLLLVTRWPRDILSWLGGSGSEHLASTGTSRRRRRRRRSARLPVKPTAARTAHKD